MKQFAVNHAPLMTSFLVNEARVFRDDPLVLLDVGARGGVGREWQAFGDQILAYCFEPNEEECRRLAAAAPTNLKYIPRALGGQRGSRTLYQTAHADSAGLYHTDMAYLGRFLNRDNGVTVGESTVEVSVLDDVLAEFNIPKIDFIKLDVEGAELEVLAGGQRCMEKPDLLGFLSEIRFHAEINQSPIFSEFDLFVRKFGFALFDIEFHYQSRIAMPYPGLQHYHRANGEPFFAYTSRGQLQDGNALYLRDLLLPFESPRLEQVSATSILKMCAVMEIFSLNDCAAELLLAARDRVDGLADTTRLLDLLATGICGTPTSFEAYVRRFDRHPTPIVANLDPQATPPPRPKTLPERLKMLFLRPPNRRTE